MPTVLVDLNGIENIVKSMAIWTLAVGSGCLLGTPFSGKRHECISRALCAHKSFGFISELNM